MREPDLYRIARCMRKNLVHAHRPRLRLIHTTAQCRLRIQEASSVKPPVSKDAGSGDSINVLQPHESTKIQAGVLERSPDRLNLYKALKKLNKGPGSWAPMCFPPPKLQLALEDLAAEDPPVRLALLGSEKTCELVRKVLYKSFYDNAMPENGNDNGGIQAPYEEPGTLSKPTGKVTHLPYGIDGRPTSIFLGRLNYDSTGTFVDPTMPLVVRSSKVEETKTWVVHRTFIIHEDPATLISEMKLEELREKSPIEFIRDVPMEIYQKETMKNGQDAKLLVSTEAALLAQEASGDQVRTGIKDSRPQNYLDNSGLTQLPDLLVAAAKRKDQGNDQIPDHVRDYLVGVLSSRTLPDESQFPTFDAFLPVAKRRDILQIEHLIKMGMVELQKQVTQLSELGHELARSPIIANSALKKCRYIPEISLLCSTDFHSAMVHGMITTSRLYLRGTPDDIKLDKYLGVDARNTPFLEDYEPLKLQAFGNFKSMIFQLGESLVPHVRARNREFLTSSGWGAVAAGLLAYNGIDPAISLSIFAAILAVSVRRFYTEVKGLWNSYVEQVAAKSTDFLQDLKLFLTDSVNSSEAHEQYLKSHQVNAESHVLLRENAAEARALLLKVAPSLRSEFPQWEESTNPSKPSPKDP
ncbi:hypothetical protein TWF481_004427 [Arthrobotrys musiformis]|uniref:Uncharacterized protein n=1 Tax=Arthrobotrys musiformis TaxID=47236 RepID=A0AAV9WJJ0_9PEZI